MSCAIPQSVYTDCRKHSKSRIDFNNFNTFNNVNRLNEGGPLILTNEDDKVCKKCGRRLSILRFYRKRKAADTYQDWCIECQRQYKAENRAKKEILRANIGQMTFDEIVKNYRSLDRASLIIIKNVLAAVLRVIEKKLK